MNAKFSISFRGNFLFEDIDSENESNEGIGEISINFNKNPRAEHTFATELY